MDQSILKRSGHMEKIETEGRVDLKEDELKEYKTSSNRMLNVSCG